MFKQEKFLNGTYTRMLRRVQNIHWTSHTTNTVLYADLPLISDKIASRRLRLAGHCHRHPELSAHDLVLWEPTHGQKNRGGQKSTYLDTLKRDTGAENIGELASLMADRDLWKSRVRARLRPP